MPTPPYNTTTSSIKQEDWITEILPRLPAGFREKAGELKAFQRKREIQSPEDLLRGLLYYVGGARSFTNVSIWGVIQDHCNVSPTDWRNRLRHSGDWLTWMLQELLAASTPASPWLVRGAWTRILLVDGTHLTCPGPHGMIWRIHTAFDLLQGRLSQIKVTDQSVSERLTFFELGAGDLIVGDKATGYAQRITDVHDRHADIVTRFTPSTLPLFTKHQERIDVIRWLKGRHAKCDTICSQDGYIERENDIKPSKAHKKQRQRGKLQELIPVRIVAYRLKPEARARAEKKTKRLASRRPTKLQAETIYMSGWIVVVTTLPKGQWSDEDVMRLYQARWHIELLFKRLKQLLHVHRLRCLTPETAQATLTATLLAWVLMEEESQAIRQTLTEAMLMMQADPTEEQCALPPLEPAASWWQDGPSGALSEWRLTSLSVDLFREQVKGTFTAQQVREHLPLLERFLHQGVRQRDSLYRRVCRWLVQPDVSQKKGPRKRTG
jgi:hypothetical protein